MNINQNRVADQLTVAPQGRLDTTTSPQLDAEIKNSLDGVTTLVLDFHAVEYISSAGLRVIFSAQKLMRRNDGRLIIRRINESVREVFEITGALDILTIEP